MEPNAAHHTPVLRLQVAALKEEADTSQKQRSLLAEVGLGLWPVLVIAGQTVGLQPLHCCSLMTLSRHLAPPSAINRCLLCFPGILQSLAQATADAADRLDAFQAERRERQEELDLLRAQLTQQQALGASTEREAAAAAAKAAGECSWVGCAGVAGRLLQPSLHGLAT